MPLALYTPWHTATYPNTCTLVRGTLLPSPRFPAGQWPDGVLSLTHFRPGTVLSRVQLKSPVKYRTILGDIMTNILQFNGYDLMTI